MGYRTGSRGNISQATKSITKYNSPQSIVDEVYLRVVKSGARGGYLNLGLELGTGGGVDPATLSAILSSSIQNAPATEPSLSALAQPLLFPSGGGGMPVTLTGNLLTGATLVTVGGSTVVPSSSTASSVTFTWPAAAASATPYSINVTTPLGTTNTLAAAAYALPSAFIYLWYAAEGYDPVGGTWTDVVGNLEATPNLILTSLNPSWISSPQRPAIAFAGGSIIKATFSELAQPGAIFMAMSTGSTPVPLALFGSDAGGTQPNQWGAQMASGSVTIVCNGSFTANFNTSNPSLLEFDYSGASSAIYQNNGTPTTSTMLGTNPLAGNFAIGPISETGSPPAFTGNCGMFGICNRLPTNPERAIMAGIATSLGWI